MRRGGGRSGLIALAVGSAMLGAGGCAVPTRMVAVDPEVARQTTPYVIEEALRKLDEAETKRRIERMLASPEMKAVERELLSGLVDGALATLGEEQRAARVGSLTAEIARSAVSGALDGALSERRQAELQRFARGLVAASVEQLEQSLRDEDPGGSLLAGLSERLGPAIEKVIRENIGRGAAAALQDEELRRALGATARTLGREMVLGAHEALAEIQREEPKRGGASLLSRLSGLAREGTELMGVISWMLVAVTVALSVWVARLLTQRRRYLSEGEHRATTARPPEAERQPRPGS